MMHSSQSIPRQMETIRFPHPALLAARSDLSSLKHGGSLSFPFHSTPPHFCSSLRLCPSPSAQIYIARFQTPAQSEELNKCFITLVISTYRSHDTRLPGINEEPLDCAGPAPSITTSLRSLMSCQTPCFSTHLHRCKKGFAQ